VHNKKRHYYIMETLEQIRPTAVTVCLARRGTGKTYLIGSLIRKWLQQKIMEHQSIILFSSTANASDDFSFLPDEYKHVYSDELLLKVMAFQKKRIQLQKRRAKASKQNSCVLSGLTLIMDDVFSPSANAKSIMHSKPIIQLFTQSRHWKISCFFLVQYPKFLTPSRRRCPYGHPENHFRSYSAKSLVLKLRTQMRALTASKDP
jgi:hypothetical protein